MEPATASQPDNFSLTRVKTSRSVPGMEEDVRSGLSGDIKRLHPKYFYDETGSQLFDQICDTPEYYLTRTEYRLLHEYAAAIIDRCQPHNLLELGSGTSRKTRILLKEWMHDLGEQTYWPFDVSGEMLEGVARELADEFPGLHIHALKGDYTAGLQELPAMDGTTLAMFLGSTLGNFRPEDAQRFLHEIVSCLKPGDYFLLGADLDKDPEVLKAAYNDAAGITEAFNKNILQVINRELDADFDLDQFHHRAIYNAQKRQMEMYLDSRIEQQVPIRGVGLEARFQAGESIFTEISRKFTLSEIETLFDSVGLNMDEQFVDQKRPYALFLGRLHA